MTIPEREITRSNPGPPKAVQVALRKLYELQPEHDVPLVGRCVVEMAMGNRPASFRARTALTREAVLEAAPRAVPGPTSRGTILLPTKAGPIDIEVAGSQPTRPARPGFRVEQLAWSTRDEVLCGPASAFEDLDARQLVLDRIQCDATGPSLALTSLRAARWIADSGFQVAPETVRTLAEAPTPIHPTERTRARQLLRHVLLTPDCREPLRFLQATRFEPFVSAGLSSAAPERAAAAPPRPRARLAALLIDADARNLLRALHFGAELSDEVFRVLAWHPIEEHLETTVLRGSALRRFVKKAPGELVADAVAIRRGEARAIAAGALETASQSRLEGSTILQRLDQVERALDEVREARSRESIRLALDGTAVMKRLDLPPGRDVGRAMAHLNAIITRDPSQNTPEALINALDRWAAQDRATTAASDPHPHPEGEPEA